MSSLRKKIHAINTTKALHAMLYMTPRSDDKWFIVYTTR